MSLYINQNQHNNPTIDLYTHDLYTQTHHSHSKNQPSQKIPEISIRILNSKKELSKGSLRLIEDLKLKKPSDKRNNIINNAIKGVYEDKLSFYPYPKIALQNHLNEADCEILAEQVLNGRYDDYDSNDTSSPPNEINEKLLNHPFLPLNPPKNTNINKRSCCILV